MGKLEKYTSYKESGVEWLGEIPEHWELKPLRSIFEERNEKNDGIKTDYILSVTKDRGVIPYDEKGAIGNNKSEDIEKYKLVYPNDFVINKMNVVIGSLGISKYYGAFSHVYLVYKEKSKNININYTAYVFSNQNFYKSLIKICTGIMELRESLNKNEFKKILLPIPPLNEQEQIISYLDTKITQIDKAIGQKEKLIALLKEQKQITINEAVTKGLDKDVELKDSGVEWLGDMPKHWELVPLKYILKERNERSTSGEETLFMMSQVHGLVVRADYHEKAEVAKDNIGNKKVYKNDLVFNKLKAHLGVFYKSNIEIVGLVSPDYAVYYSNDKIDDVKFLEVLFRHPKYIGQFISLATGIVEGLIRLYTDDLFSLKVAVPPKEEQEQIITFIEKETAKIDKAIELQQNYIAKLKEYKASLIDSVVTGKVRVA